MAVGSAAVALSCIFCAVFAGWVAPHNPTDLATLELSDSMLPPAWMTGGTTKYLLGTDEQGRDALGAHVRAPRFRCLSALHGCCFPLDRCDAGPRFRLCRRPVDAALIMRICDVMLSFPSILIALLIAGVGHALFPNARDTLAFGVLIIAIALPGWAQYAAPCGGRRWSSGRRKWRRPPASSAYRRCASCAACALNVLGPVLVLSTIQVATAIIAEATLSFLGVGVSPTSPSLGTFINEGRRSSSFSGAWWLVIFPGFDVATHRSQHQPLRRLVARRIELAPALTVKNILFSLKGVDHATFIDFTGGAMAAVAACTLAACASVGDDYHFSQIYGNRYFRTPIDTYAVSGSFSVDGKDNVFRPAPRGSRACARSRFKGRPAEPGVSGDQRTSGP